MENANAVYAFVKYITVHGKRLYARDYGKKAFRIQIKTE